MSLPAYSVKHPVAIWMVVLAIVLFGTLAFTQLPVELKPNVSFGDITILINIRGGIPPTEVEAQVTKVVEEAVGTVEHLESMLSISKEAESRVQLSFVPGTDMDFATLEVREKFDQIKDRLPKEIEKPIIDRYQQADWPIMIVALTSNERTPEQLRRLVDEKVKEVIERAPGVANVEVAGGRERKIMVEVDQRRLQAFGIPIHRVTGALNVNNLNLLSGEVKGEERKFLVRTIGEFRTLEDIGNIGVAVSPQGSVVRLKDVARVADSFLEPVSLARVNGKPVVSLWVQRDSDANTIAVADAVEEQIRYLREDVLEPDVILTPVRNEAEFIRRSIRTVQTALVYGALLAGAVLLVFLREPRFGAIIATTIPISVLATFGLMLLAQRTLIPAMTLNIMTLSGLALGIGMLLDNAIIVLDRIVKEGDQTPDRRAAAIQGAERVALVIIASTATTVVVFLPVIFVSTEQQLLYGGFILTLVSSIAASLFAAVTLVPLLMARVRRSRRALSLAWLLNGYTWCLRRALAVRYPLCAVAFLLAAVALYDLAYVMKKEFFSQTEQSDFTVFVELPTGAKLEASDGVVGQVEDELKKVPEIEMVSARIERWSSKVYARLKPAEERERTVKQVIDDLRPVTDQIEPAFIYFEEPQDTETQEVIIDIFGFEYRVLEDLARQVFGVVAAVPGLTDHKIRHRRGRPELQYRVDREKAALYGFSVQEVADSLHAQMRGLVATRYHTEAKEVETITRLDEQYRKTIKDLRHLTLTTRRGESVTLDQLGEFRFGEGPSEIWRKNKARMIQVSANKGKLGMTQAVEAIRFALGGAVSFPPDYYYRFGGGYERNLKNQQELLLALGIAMLLVYLVLASLFESYVQPFIVIAVVPMALVGVQVGLRLAHLPVGQGVFLGGLCLIGIVVNNPIIQVEYVNEALRAGGPLREALERGGRDRLRPILMTTSTTILGLIPTALDKSEGAMLWAPIAVTLIGGLSSSLILTLFLVPAMYAVQADVKDWVGWRAARAPAGDLPRGSGVGIAPIPGLTGRQAQALQHIREVGRITRREYAERWRVSRLTAARDLRVLVEAGHLEAGGPLGPDRWYVLRSAGPEQASAG